MHEKRCRGICGPNNESGSVTFHLDVFYFIFRYGAAATTNHDSNSFTTAYTRPV